MCFETIYLWSKKVKLIWKENYALLRFILNGYTNLEKSVDELWIFSFFLSGILASQELWHYKIKQYNIIV